LVDFITKMGKATGFDGVRLLQLLLFNLDYSRIEFAADARHGVCGCGSSPQMACKINGDRPHFVRKRTFSYRKWGLSPFITVPIY